MICPKCGAQLSDGSTYCTSCGNYLQTNSNNNMQGRASQTNMTGGASQPMYYMDPSDHTGEFLPKDISDNKVMAMLPYLLGTIGVIIALLASRESAYTYFHVRQALKLTVVNVLIAIVSLILFWTVIIPIAAGIGAIILFVIRIICFFQVCSGKAKEPAIIRSLGFLK